MLKPKYAAILASVWIFAPLMLMSGIGHSQQEKKGLSKRPIPDTSKQRPKLDLELLEKSAEKYSDEGNHVSALLLRQQIVTVLEKSTDRRTQIALATAITQIATSHISLATYSEALPPLIRALAIREKVLADQSTAVLIADMHRRCQTQNLTKIEALRQAQLALQSQPKCAHPYYWAPFILMGNWK